MEEKAFAMGSIRRVAKQIVDLGDKKRKEILMTCKKKPKALKFPKKISK